MEITKRHLIILFFLALLLNQSGFAQKGTTATYWTGTLAAGTYKVTTTTGSKFTVKKGTETVGTYDQIKDLTVSNGNVTIEFNTTANVYFIGKITVSGGKLTLKKTSDYNMATLRRPDAGNAADAYAPSAQVVISGGTLEVRGIDADHPFLIYGGCRGSNESGSGYTINDGNSFDFSATAEKKFKAENVLVYITGGTLDMQYATIYHNWNDKGSGGGLEVNAKTNPVTVKMDHTSIYNCYCKDSGAAILVSAEVASSITMTHCTINRCFSYGGNGVPSSTGGIIRTTSSGKCTLSMTDCQLYGNYNVSTGGAITWNACTIDALSLTRCNIHDNWR